MLRLVWDNTTGDADLSNQVEGTDITRPLETAVIMSLFCDARSGDTDDVPDGDRRGWWAEAYFDENDTWGSKLWHMFTRKATQGSLRDAQRYAESALQWLIDDGVAGAVDIETWWLEGRQGYMGILVTLHKPDETAPQYLGPWEVYYGAT